ncbi:hypothetical protein BUY35_01485 [Staphylococcus cohnii]|uniref:Uncharacterized protein n=1 Tax=Staphylococcus cohnii TaxID=29382 RepID=A0A2T4LR49_9STAP|nr:hypothetical protein BUY36_07445 [Staphylococcus cohnii]PTF20747.1 hypothetical protein BUY40_05660 [Staphylococcus cohnii]PTF23130.1 hypothetical protein BUY31_09780 [Staphylococcus cohnii]PTF23480.1 hypothetical protein BUY30_09385 [Staphylococcus cohnii]PTF32618.1 hypothetical protein BUY21_09265 [Staphylococcus cohnii]
MLLFIPYSVLLACYLREQIQPVVFSLSYSLKRSAKIRRIYMYLSRHVNEIFETIPKNVLDECKHHCSVTSYQNDIKNHSIYLLTIRMLW